MSSINYTYINRPIPYINIHAFCVSDAFLQHVESAANDRRMYRTKTTTQQGSLESAVTYYKDRSTPDLLIIEANDATSVLIDRLIALAQYTEKHTKVIVATSINDVGLYRELSRYGVSDCLTLPTSALGIIDAIAGLFSTSAPRGKTTVFMSTKGGAGSSILAANSAWYLSQHSDDDVLLIDYDVYFGTAAHNFGIAPDKSLGDLLEAQNNINEEILDSMAEPINNRFKLLAAPCILSSDFRFSAGSCEAIANNARRVASCAIIDLPYGFLQNNRESLLLTDSIVLVSTTDKASIRNLVDVYAVLHDARPHDTPPMVVINKFGAPGYEKLSLSQLDKTLGFRPDFIVPFEPNLFQQASQNSLVPSQVKNINNEYAQIANTLSRLAKAVTNKRIPQDKSQLLPSLKNKRKTVYSDASQSSSGLTDLLKKIIKK